MQAMQPSQFTLCSDRRRSPPPSKSPAASRSSEGRVGNECDADVDTGGCWQGERCAARREPEAIATAGEACDSAATKDPI